LNAVNRALVWLHRWTGVGLCLLFLVWFASGAVLAYVPFPSLPDEDRLASDEPLDLAQVRVAPARALAAAGGGDQLRLIQAAGHAAYVVQRGTAPARRVDASTGAPLGDLSADQARAAAEAFAGAPAGSVEGPLMYDQWIVHQAFDPWRPFYRVSLGDPAGTQLYVSARTGEVVQRTRATERAWNWVGAVSHWLYFTALRKSFAAWDQSVWWVSLAGLATTLIGTWLGVARTWTRMRGRRPDWSPFRGWLRWHHGLGLGVAVFTLTWMFSGWLSMDHGRLFSRGAPAEDAQARYRGASLQAALARGASGDLARLGPTRRITFAVVGGQGIAAAEGGQGETKVAVLGQPAPAVASRVPIDLIVQAAARAWPLADRAPQGPTPGDSLYRLADSLPARAIRLALSSPAGAGVYIDPVTGRILVLMDASREAYAWTYYALHTFNFPGLIERPALRRGIEATAMALGVAFSLTGLLVAIRRLRMTLTR
jgi:hypothetical protein